LDTPPLSLSFLRSYILDGGPSLLRLPFPRIIFLIFLGTPPLLNPRCYPAVSPSLSLLSPASPGLPDSQHHTIILGRFNTHLTSTSLFEVGDQVFETLSSPFFRPHLSHHHFCCFFPPIPSSVFSPFFVSKNSGCNFRIPLTLSSPCVFSNPGPLNSWAAFFPDLHIRAFFRFSFSLQLVTFRSG